MSRQSITVSVWRGTQQGRLVSYQVPLNDNQTVLDTVTWIQRHHDPDLSYRFACRVGMCGSCAMTVNGRARWTCRTHVRTVLEAGELRIEPLANLPVIKDLAVNMAPFFDKMTRARGHFIARNDDALARDNGFSVVQPESPARRAADDAIECIGCAACYAACDVVRWNDQYLGPAALNRAWSLINDARDGANGLRLVAVAGDAGCHACHTQQSCAEHCPKHLNPTASIAGLKRRVASALIKGEL